MKKKILVTGVAGFLGSNLLKKLLNKNHSVVGIDNLSTGKLGNIRDYLEHPRFTFLHKDIVAKSTFIELPSDIDMVVHLGAFKIPRYDKAIDTLQINSLGSISHFEMTHYPNLCVVL